jgi:hypothetical protein
MHTLKAVLVLGAALAVGAVSASAQDQSAGQSAPATQPQANPQAAPGTGGRHHHGKKNPAKMAAHLAKKLNLSADQQAQLTPILADRQQQMQALRADTSLAQTDRRAKAQQIRQDSQSKIEAMLNDQQKQQFEQLLAERRAHHKGKKQGAEG